MSNKELTQQELNEVNGAGSSAVGSKGSGGGSRGLSGDIQVNPDSMAFGRDDRDVGSDRPERRVRGHIA